MQARGDLTEDTREKLIIISAQIQRITQVTNDMTNFARARPVARSLVNVNRVVETSLRLASFDKSFQVLTIETRLTENIEQLVADADQLQQVVLNLLLNARDAMPDGGTLTIGTEQIDSEIAISIADSGGGIDDAAAQHIFDPFYTTKPAGKGTGLGLAVCYGIVTAHGGRIELAANEPSGTIFRVMLPITTEN
jgi:signal transduction histidine kinase